MTRYEPLPAHDAAARLPARAASSLVGGLNPAQARAVTHGDGPLLVLAGAGSGKTRVIAHRIAHLIVERGVRGSRILAVTFTNKAASEMRERVERLLGQGLECWVGTFHALCLRLLRREFERLGLPRDFTVFDTDDQLAVIKRVLKAFAAEDQASPRAVLSRISRAKNALVEPTTLAAQARGPEERLAAAAYPEYQRSLAALHGVDFDDLLLGALRLFEEHEDLAERYSGRCEHLLVDEYQDTNRPQYRLIRHLSRRHGNVFVVGDEDQSIYRFRGAEIRNILDFERDHPGTQVVRLEQNYRSTKTILAAAGAVIAHNRQRKGKTLWTENVAGAALALCHAPDDRAEAAWVARRLHELAPTHAWDECAVLYRTNAQSRLLEELLRRERIPYQIVGAVQFYERKEVKDLLSYLRLAANPADSVSFRRVLNTPPRGIGDTTLGAIEGLARRDGSSLLDAARTALGERALGRRPASGVEAFVKLIDELGAQAPILGPAGLLERAIRVTDYEAYLDKTYPGQGAERMENVRALVSAAVEYAEEDAGESLQEFLDRSALVASADEVGDRPGVTLMTIHCAKGLEFRAVFLVGLEESLFPHAMSALDEDEVEEERRLCYVALTRARETLTLTRARFRRNQGVLLPTRPSRFLREIPAELIQEVEPPEEAGFFDDGSVGEERAGSSAARVAFTPRARTAPNPRPVVRPQADPGDGYRVGAAVIHPSFGSGRILDREGAGNHLKLTIQFQRHGTKKILPAYTRLELR